MCVFWPPFVHAWYLSFWPDPAGPGASLWVRHSLRMVVGDEVTKGIGKVVQELHVGVWHWCWLSVRWWWTRCTRLRRSSPRSGRTGICIRFWCRNNPSFRLNGLVQFRFNCASDNVFTHVHTVLTKLPPRSINHHFCNMQYMWKGGTLTGARRLHYVQYTV